MRARIKQASFRIARASSRVTRPSPGGTFAGGILHTLPFLIPQYRAALVVAVATVALELVTLAWIRWRQFHTGFLSSFASVALGGAIIATVSALLGIAAG